jgi:hypothetical protein
MLTCEQEIHSFAELHDYVNQTICQHYQLKLDAYPLTERTLTRSGRPCGIYFCLHGPRAVKFIAIWETDSNSILFYGSDGERFQRTRLTDAPSFEFDRATNLAAAAA